MKNPVRCTEQYLADRAMQTNFMLALRSYSEVYIQKFFLYDTKKVFNDKKKLKSVSSHY